MKKSWSPRFAVLVGLLAVVSSVWSWRQGDLAAQAARGRQTAPPIVARPQAKQPPLELPGYQLPRSAAAIRAAYKFAAEHPEILSYLPCFCGCERSGHGSNVDCFVKTRARNGDVTAWNEHGMECSMCLAIDEEAMKLHAAGKSAGEIRAAVEEKYGSLTDFRTATPQPPQR